MPRDRASRAEPVRGRSPTPSPVCGPSPQGRAIRTRDGQAGCRGNATIGNTSIEPLARFSSGRYAHQEGVPHDGEDRRGLPLLSRRRRDDGRDDPPSRLVGLAARTAGDVVGLPLRDREPAAQLALSHVRRLRARTRLPLQRRLRRHPRQQAPRRARSALRGRLARDLDRDRAPGQGRARWRGDLGGGLAGHDRPQRARRTGVVHLFLLAGA